MEHFNWLELVVVVVSSVLSYLTGHKIATKNCDNKESE